MHDESVHWCYDIITVIRAGSVMTVTDMSCDLQTTQAHGLPPGKNTEQGYISSTGSSRPGI